MTEAIKIIPLDGSYLVAKTNAAQDPIAGLTNANDLVEWIAKKYGATNVIDDEAIGHPDDRYTFADFGISGLPLEPDVLPDPVVTVSDNKPVTLDDLESTVKEVHDRKRPGPTIEEQGGKPTKTNEKKTEFLGWTDTTIDAAASMWKDGLSNAEIGKRLGTTGNSVAGMAYRHHDMFPVRQAAPVRPAKEKRPKPAVPDGQAKILKHLELVASKAGQDFNIDTDVLATKAGVDRESTKPFLLALKQKGLITYTLTGNNALISVKEGVAA